MADKWELLKSRIAAGIDEINRQDRGKDPETHARYRGMVAGLTAVQDWMRMSDGGTHEKLHAVDD